MNITALQGNKFGTWLKKAMADHDLQQRDLAYLLGISEQNISRYANGVIVPSLNTIIKILGVFNCHLEIVPDVQAQKEGQQ